jgi:hypothetical protein
VQAAAVLSLLLMSVVLWLAPTPAAGWRLVAGLAAIALGWRPVREIIFQRGRKAVRRFEWDPAGAWLVSGVNGERRPVRLHPATATLGSWILLVWGEDNGEPGSRPGSTARRYALIDAAGVGRAGFRTLKGRLRLEAARPNPTASR